MSIANKIFVLRKQYNFSQEDLADKMNVARQTISNWELGETSPGIDQAKKLAKIFNISLEELTCNDLTNVLISKTNKI